MDPHRSALAPIAFAALLACAAAAPLAAQAPDHWVAPERRARRPNPVAADSTSLERGQRVYERQCASCHGNQGDNDGRDRTVDMTRSRRLSDPSLLEESDGALYWKITEGRNQMPNTLETLSDFERWSVVNYMRTFQHRRSR